MDKFVKHVKRPWNGSYEKPSASSSKFKDIPDFYFPDSSRSNGSNNIISNDDMMDHPIVPETPQKSCEPDSATMTFPEMTDYWTKRTGKPDHIYVTRRLLFDDEINTDDQGKKRKDMVINSMDTTSEEMITLFEKKMTSVAVAAAAKNSRFRSIVESISGRGFVVTKVLDRPSQSCCSNTGTEEEDSVSVFECVSVLEGIVYCVLASATAHRDKSASATMAAARTLSAVGPHPNIVAFHSSWSDGRFHYVQTEMCRDNLWSSPSGPLKGAADCRTVLEHVACALHYLHDCKGYAHNQVNGENVYPVADGDHVVYKLGGFDGATRLSHVDAARASFADVKSLCSTVSLLVEGCGDGDEDLLSLRSYLSYVIRKIDSVSDVVGWTAAADVNAFAVWRWCCAARQQQGQRSQQLMMPVVYGNSCRENDGGPMDTAEAIPATFSDGAPQQASSWSA
ncbi:uncharacterized protein LOC112682510 [Sipha flava]|uniref:Uncharacterized protein LOC112682510 n=1 Tax=Sipha flava TaxID=143950 RepID=A0A8B8FEM4_9HEMI|nr:uncharacterized protein LOC112682510 [Sipha flava]